MTCCQIVRFDVQLPGVSRGLTARRLNASEGGRGAEMVTAARYCEQETIDIASALARMDGDVDLLKDLLKLFLEGLPEMLVDLREAVRAGDASAIEFGAHNLKGSVGNFAAQPAFEAALKLEAIGRDGRLSEAEQAYAELENEIDRFTSAIGKFYGAKMMIQ